MNNDPEQLSRDPLDYLEQGREGGRAMTGLLFDVPQQLSPRLAWMENHRISTHYAQGEDYPWVAWQNCNVYDYPHEGNAKEGDTEDEAITKLAKKLGLKLWNEE